MQWNILLVDDDKTITSSLHRLIHAEPWQIFTTHNAEDALQILIRHDIHVLVADFFMPSMDGLELCQKVQSISPHTYRLMLSGQLDSPALHAAWRSGLVHRFLAKPWDNDEFKRDMREGIQRHRLMRKSQQLMQSIAHQNALLITDENWIVLFASAPLLALLQLSERDLVGKNLFSPTLANIPPSLETEVTWQTEHDLFWVGDFRFQGLSQAMRMSINPLDKHFRIVLCESITEDVSPPQNLRKELQRYSGEHQLHRLQEDTADQGHALGLIQIEFAAEYAQNSDFSAICYLRLRSTLGKNYDIYSPQSNVYLIPLLHEHSQAELAHLHQCITKIFQEPMWDTVITPNILIEHQPEEFEYQSDWLRARSSIPETKPVEPSNNAEQHLEVAPILAVPLFNQAGKIMAIKPHNTYFTNSSDWLRWINHAQEQWQDVFDTPLNLVVDICTLSAQAQHSLIEALLERPEQAIQTHLLLSEHALLTTDSEQALFRQQFMQAGCQFILQNYNGDASIMRKIQHLPLSALCLSKEALMQLDFSKNTAQDKRLRRLKDQNLHIMAMHINSTDELIIAKNYNVDCLAGDLLSPPINLHQLAWFDAPLRA